MLKHLLGAFFLCAALLFLSACNRTADNGIQSSSGVQAAVTLHETDSTAPARLAEVMPILSVKTNGSYPITSNIIYRNAVVSSEDTLPENAFSDLSAAIRCRGNYTYTSVPKKSYRLKFDEKINLFGQDEGKAKNWVLLANFTDRSLLRNDTAFAMAGALSYIEEVTSSGFVRLYINDTYAGIYQLCEQHSVSSHRIAIVEQPDVLDSDYFIEMDAYASGVEGQDYFCVENKRYAVKNDQIHPDAIQYLTEYIEAVNQAILEGDEASVSRLIDLDSFIDMYILQEFVRNVDAGWSSFYMVKEANGKLRFTWPWDFDLAFGNDIRLGDAPYEGLYAGNDDYSDWANSNPWFYRLMRRKWFVDRVIERWNEVGKAMTDAGLERINLVQETWGAYMETNFDVWPILGTDFYPTPYSIAKLTEYSAAVDQLRSWIQNRYDWLDAYLNDPDRCFETVID